MTGPLPGRGLVRRRRYPQAHATGWIVVLLALVVSMLVTTPATAQEQSSEAAPTRITISFGPEQVWQPGPTALQSLFECRRGNFTCVREVMEQNNATPDAVAFYRLTGWFLSDIQMQNSDDPVLLGHILTPFRANENAQMALLGGIPPVVYPEEEGSKLASAAEASNTFTAIKSAHPQAWFWPSGPSFEGTAPSPLGGPRFIFRYRVLDGCHACAILGYVRVAFDFAPDGTYDTWQLLEGR